MEIPHQPSIASCYQQSIARFEGVCRLLETPGYQNSHQNVFSLLSDELGRLRAWAGSCGAHRMPSSRLSLDHRLREASHIQERVTELLVELMNNLKDVVEVLVSVTETSTCSATQREPDSDSDSDSDSRIDFSPNHCAIQDGSVEEPNSDIDYIASNITHIITCLYKLSMIIHSPAPRDRLHKSQAIPVAHFLPYEKQHVQDKFPQAPDFLVERLAHANVVRRQLLKYYQLHQRNFGYGQPAGPEFSSDQRPVITDTTPPTTDNNKSSVLEISRPLVTCIDRKKEGTISTIVNSQTTVSAYTGPQELTFDPLSAAEVESEGGISRTSFSSSSGGIGGLYIPHAPSLFNEAPFQCPYCFLIIRPKNTDSWLRHIFKDLQPYICTFEDCAMPERLFRTRQAWYEHEVKYHRKHWLCKMCNISFTEALLLEEHIKAYHHTASDVAHILIEHCGVPVETAQICPLCATGHYPGQLQRHLARHLQELALFALPKVGAGEDLESMVSHTTQNLLQVEDDMDFQSPFGSIRNSNSTTASEPHLSVEHIKVPEEVVAESSKGPVLEVAGKMRGGEFEPEPELTTDSTADLLAEVKRDPNFKGILGRTRLSVAAAYGHEAIVRVLVGQAEVETNSKDYNGQTPLSLAAEKGHENVARLLFEREDVNADSKDTYGRTPLSWAAWGGHEDVVRLLIAREDMWMQAQRILMAKHLCHGRLGKDTRMWYGCSLNEKMWM
ncbi:hypothetical protein L211DRAFT_314263 [Terfezia boudieri ATCC MYA-4762]|uniref:C2H2-type domain-containing protein n=1 Tax=Terfezia boudieri ATCC MYA-4762 TaxID=1051890 RepID=A0A3N4LLL2_9PEZI|nr:hypothetical protein L211DRAFT_314263 [Terfezia boudieri ATCC MYA-4762]